MGDESGAPGKKSRYRKIEVRMWGDERFRRLSPIPACGQGLWIYLLTGPHTSAIPGLFRAGRAAMAEELEWDIEAFDKAFDEAFSEGMVKADWKARLVWIPKAAECNRPESPNVVTSWRDSWELLPECELKREAYESLRAFVEGLGAAYLKAFDKAIPKPSVKPSAKAMPNQEQEQEQEQKQVKPIVDLKIDTTDPAKQEVVAQANADGQRGLGLDDPTPPASGGDESGDGDVVAGGKTQAEVIEGVFDYWRRTMASPKSKLDDKRKGVIRRALKAGYSPRDLCRAIQGCARTPHNQGNNERGEKYLGIDVCLRDADQIDRFMANAKAPPVAPAKQGSGQIPGWWKDDGLAKQQAAQVGVVGPHPHESRETFHARIRAAIDNGGKPPEPVAAPAPVPVAPPEERVQLTDEQKAANRASLQAALNGVGVKVTGNGISME